MKTTRFLKVAGVFVALVIESVSFACPEYANQETRRIVEAMVDAHGGIERWRSVPSIRFDNLMHMEGHDSGQFGWWVAHEVIDQETRQVWQDWPMENSRVGFDGEQVWSENWQQGNPTAMMVHFFYYFVNLPWLTQDEGVILSAAEKANWGDIDKTLYKIEMTFDGAPSVGKSGKDFFVLYIDPESYRLVSYQYGSGYRPLTALMGMPEGSVFGPMWRVITHYEEVEGLLFPSAFRTMPEPNGRIVGDHVIMNIDVSKPFEYEKASIAAGAVIFGGPLRTD